MMDTLKGKHVVVGVTGSIAAYKSALLIRALVQEGADVRVVMTPAACEFISPLTLATLSTNEVVVEMFPSEPSKGTWHIRLGIWADCMIVAPASANTIAKFAHGFADNALCALALALRCPMIVAPVMDMDMLQHTATQVNIEILRGRGVTIVEPEEGELASGLSGPGRLPDMPVLVEAVAACLQTQNEGDMAGKHILVTAGPTQERIDAVRYVGNFSSGKMGFAIAEMARQRGADVTLIAGPVTLSTPEGVTRIDVESAQEMFDAVKARYEQADIIVMAAAVADFRPEKAEEGKIKKETLSPEDMAIRLVRNPDILEFLGKDKGNRTLIGFALEVRDGIHNALDKLTRKNTDMIVLNSAVQEGAGFGADTNIATLVYPNGEYEELPLMPKRNLAGVILTKAMERTAKQ